MRSMVATPSRSEVARVGFIGLGDMGGALASRIIDAGFPTVLWARRPQVLSPFVGPTRARPPPLPPNRFGGGPRRHLRVGRQRRAEVVCGRDGVLAGAGPAR